MGLGTMLPAKGTDFRDSLKGETVYVIGSGSSVDHIPREFFFDKLCVCVNNVGRTLKLPVYATVTHYHRDAIHAALARPDLPVIAPMTDLGAGGPEAADREPAERNIYRFNTGVQMFGGFIAERDWPTDPDTLVVGPTSLHMTMHFAAYTGAAHIVLVGADCGLLDGGSNFAGYKKGDNPFDVWQATLAGVADQIRATGTSVHSLNPFVNFALEGHSFHGPTVNIN